MTNIAIRGTFEWGWAEEDNMSVICTSPVCYIGVGPWDRRGGPPKGGINSPLSLKELVQVPNGATTRDAFVAWTTKYGTQGAYTQDMWEKSRDISTTCHGFQSFPARSGTGTLLPGTTCGLIPPANLICNIVVPSGIDLGTVHVGTTDVTGSTVGEISCSSTADVYASLINRPEIDMNSVLLYANKVKLNEQTQKVGNGKIIALDLSATVSGKLLNAGVYQTDAIIMISYK